MPDAVDEDVPTSNTSSSGAPTTSGSVWNNCETQEDICINETQRLREWEFCETAALHATILVPGPSDSETKEYLNCITPLNSPTEEKVIEWKRYALWPNTVN
jgi:hypothetical protein